MKFLNVFFIASLFVSSSCAFSMSPEYSFSDIGTLESDESTAILINDNNEVLGKYKFNGETKFFIWNKDNGIHLVEIPEQASVKKMSNTGKIIYSIGETITGDDGRKIFTSRSFIYDSENGSREITDENGTRFFASDINDNGDVIGSFYENGEYTSCVIANNNQIFKLKGVTGDLGLTPSNVTVSSINNNLDIAGSSQKIIVHKGKIIKIYVAVILRSCNNWEPEELFPGEMGYTQAISINDNGLILCKKQDCLYVVDYSEVTKEKKT